MYFLWQPLYLSSRNISSHFSEERIFILSVITAVLHDDGLPGTVIIRLLVEKVILAVLLFPELQTVSGL